MSPRTKQGKIFENMIYSALADNNYRFVQRQMIEPNIGGGKQFVDAVVKRKDGSEVLVSLKYQGGSGSVDEKIPCEIIKLMVAIEARPRVAAAYIVLCGKGFHSRLAEFYLSGGLKKYMHNVERVKIITLDDFLNLVNYERL
jgi:hypothetical protein